LALLIYLKIMDAAFIITVIHEISYRLIFFISSRHNQPLATENKVARYARYFVFVSYSNAAM